MSAPAYPSRQPNEHFTHAETYHAGLTKRELFAAMAMQGHISGGGVIKVGDDARNWVRIADALIAALEDKP